MATVAGPPSCSGSPWKRCAIAWRSTALRLAGAASGSAGEFPGWLPIRCATVGPMRLLSWLVAAVAMLALAGPAAAQVYSWTDERGVVHYTADPASVPPAFRTPDMPAASEPVVVERHGGWESWGVPQATKPMGTTVQFAPGEPIVVAARLNG